MPAKGGRMQDQHRFLEACEQGNLDQVQHYLRLGSCAPLAMDNLGLRLAVQHHHMPVVNFLLRTPGIEHSTGLMKLMWTAIEGRHYDVVAALVPHVYVETNQGYLLKWAVVRGDVQLVAQLAPHFHNEDHVFEAFIDAVRNNNLAIVQTLLDFVDPKSHDSEAFHLACGRGHIEIVRCLLPLCTPSAKHSEGLLWACVGNHINVIDVILPYCDVEHVLNTQLLFSNTDGFGYLEEVWTAARQKDLLNQVLEGGGIVDLPRKI